MGIHAETTIVGRGERGAISRRGTIARLGAGLLAVAIAGPAQSGAAKSGKKGRRKGNSRCQQQIEARVQDVSAQLQAANTRLQEADTRCQQEKAQCVSIYTKVCTDNNLAPEDCEAATSCCTCQTGEFLTCLSEKLAM